MELDFEYETLDIMSCYCCHDVSSFLLLGGTSTFLKTRVGFKNYILRFQGGRRVHLLKTWSLEFDGHRF